MTMTIPDRREDRRRSSGAAPPLPTAADFPLDRLTTNLATLPTMPARWLWGSGEPLADGRLVQYIPRDELTLIAAKGGTGKGFLIALIAAAVTRGRAFPYMPAESAQPAGDVLIVAPEDNPITALGPRLIAAGADRSRVHDLTLLPSGELFALPSSLDILIKAASQFRDLRVIIIDPIAAAVDFQMTSVYQARAVLEPLVQLAGELGISIIVTCHLTKDGKVHGSPAVVDTPRYVWRIDRDKRNTGIRRLQFEKGNNIEAGQSAQFTIRDDGSGPRAVFLDRSSVRAQRLQPMIRAALAYQKKHGGCEITGVTGGGVAEARRLAAQIRTVHPLDGAAKVLAGMRGEQWADMPEPERRKYRLDAAEVITAGEDSLKQE